MCWFFQDLSLHRYFYWPHVEWTKFRARALAWFSSCTVIGARRQWNPKAFNNLELSVSKARRRYRPHSRSYCWRHLVHRRGRGHHLPGHGPEEAEVGGQIQTGDPGTDLTQAAAWQHHQAPARGAAYIVPHLPVPMPKPQPMQELRSLFLPFVLHRGHNMINSWELPAVIIIDLLLFLNW